MIAYVQADSPDVWYDRLSAWIKELDGSVFPGWTSKDLLRIDLADAKPNVAIYHSSHTREKDLPDIDIRHLWIEMPG